MKPQKFEKYSFNKSVIDLDKVEIEEILNDENPIIFDTNFLFVTFEFRLDVVSEIQKLVGTNYTLYIYEGTLGELESVERKGDKNKKFLPLISTMLKRYNFKIIKSKQSYIDDQIIENAQNGVIIATNDKELRKKLWEIPARVMYMRQKSYLEIK